MLRVSKVDEWLPRPRDAERPPAGPRAHGDCVLIRPGGRLPVDPPAGSSQQPAAGARMRPHLAILPPRTRGRPHFHADQATAIHVVSGETEVWHGDGLAQRWLARAGDVVCVPPGAPHLTVNRGDVKFKTGSQLRDAVLADPGVERRKLEQVVVDQSVYPTW